MASPFFSVVIPTYNRANRIAKTIDSILQQTFQDFEVIVVDDASSDNTFDVIRSINDTRISYLRNEFNEERCVSRNKGIQKARGQYVCFLDSDDYFLVNHLSELHASICANHGVVALFFTNAYNQIEDGALCERKVPPYSPKNPFSYILTYTFNPTRTCIHKDIFKHFVFDPVIPGIEDMDLWLRIATHFPVIHVPKYTCVYVHHSESYTDGDPLKVEKDFRSYNIVFNKPLLKYKLPRGDKNRILSMCHYFFALQADKKGAGLFVIYHAVRSFLLCPTGYNLKTNKILLVISLYNIPLLGKIIKKLNYWKKSLCA